MDRLELNRNPKVAQRWTIFFGFLMFIYIGIASTLLFQSHNIGHILLGTVIAGLFIYGFINMLTVTTILYVDNTGITIYPQQPRLKKHIPWNKVDFISASSWRRNKFIIVHYTNKSGRLKHCHIQTTGVGMNMQQLTKWAKDAENYDPKWRAYYD